MNPAEKTYRRGFLGRMLGAVAAAGLPFGARDAAAQVSGPDDWIKEVKGTHRCLFDFPQHKNGMPLLHILNYLNTYSAAYKTGAGTGRRRRARFYSIGPQASIPLAFNDAMWAKYGLGEYTGLKDAAGKPYTRNVFNQPTKDDLHLLMDGHPVADDSGARRRDARDWASRACRRWARSSCCAPTRSAPGAWNSRRAARARPRIFRRNCVRTVLPGVTIVPAMVIAIEKAQEAGIRYNRQ